MDWFVRAFIKSSLVWLGLGVMLGVVMAVSPAAIVYRPAHVHANLLGFVTMMIFGVAYHVLPRFVAKPLHSSGVAGLHVVVANVGLASMVAGFIAAANALTISAYLLRGGAVISAFSAFMFIYNIWRTLDSPTARITQQKGRKTA